MATGDKLVNLEVLKNTVQKEVVDLKSAMDEYGLYTVFDGRFTGAKYTGNTSNFFLVKTISKECTIKRVVWAGESGTPKIAVIRGTTVVGLYTLLPNDTNYKTIDIDIPCNAGDMIFIGGANKCCYEKTDSSVESEKEFPNTSVAVGNTVTITSNPTIYFRWDIALYAVSDGIVTRIVEEIDQKIEKENVSELVNIIDDLEIYDSYFINSHGNLESNAQWTTVLNIPFSKGTKITFKCSGNTNVYFYCVKNIDSVLDWGYTASSLAEYTWESIYANATTITISMLSNTYDRRLFTTETNIDEILEKNPIGIPYNLNYGNILKYIETNNPVEYFGRWFPRQIGQETNLCTNNQGAMIMFSIDGATYLSIGFDQYKDGDNQPYIAYSIDGGTFVRAQISASMSITIPDTLYHTVCIVIDAIDPFVTGAHKWNGNLLVYMSKFETDGITHGLLPRNRIGVFFGDSVTEGINAIGTDSSANSNSAISSYTMSCCRHLNTAPFFVGYGGTGVINQSSFHECISAVYYYYNGVKTDFVNADFVVINHGINDYSQSVSDFVTAYSNTIDAIHNKFPGIPVFIVRGFHDTQSKFAPGLEKLARQKSNCYYIDTNGWGGETTDGTHLSANGAEHDGKMLAERIMNIMGKQFFE